MRISDSVTASAKPMLAEISKVMLEMPFTFSSTCLPKIKRLGSATATKKAMIAPETKIKSTFLLRIKLEPKKEPIGIMPKSIPCKNNVSPKTIRMEPLTNE